MSSKAVSGLRIGFSSFFVGVGKSGDAEYFPDISVYLLYHAINEYFGNVQYFPVTDAQVERRGDLTATPTRGGVIL